MNDQNMDFAFINNLIFDNGATNTSFVFQSSSPTSYKSFAFKNNFYDSVGGSLGDDGSTSLIIAAIADGNSKKVVTDILFGTSLQQANGKYYLPILSGSPAINAGINSFFLNSVNIVPQTDILGSPIVQTRDLGAYETSITTANNEIGLFSQNIFPTSFSNEILLPKDAIAAELYDVTGKILIRSARENKILTSNISSGVYIVRLTLKSGSVSSSKVIKK